VYSEIASNKRRSIIFIGLFLLIWLSVGAVLGLLVRATVHSSGTSVPPAQPTSSWTPIVIGVVIGALLAIVGILYSLTAGTRLVLRTAGAVPADPAWPLGRAYPHQRSTSSTTLLPMPSPRG
jgi:hypothetical protein